MYYILSVYNIFGGNMNIDIRHVCIQCIMSFCFAISIGFSDELQLSF
jgi:hypothetical protein